MYIASIDAFENDKYIEYKYTYVLDRQIIKTINIFCLSFFVNPIKPPKLIQKYMEIKKNIYCIESRIRSLYFLNNTF